MAKEDDIRRLAAKCNVTYSCLKFILSVDDDQEMLEDKIDFLKNVNRYVNLSGSFIPELKAESLSQIHKIPINIVEMVLVTEEKISSVLSRETRLAFLAKVMKALLRIVDHNLP